MDADQIDNIEQELLGTCKAVYEVVEGDKEQWEALRLIGERGNIERCEICSWWVEMSEITEKDEQAMCEDCAQTS